MSIIVFVLLRFQANRRVLVTDEWLRVKGCDDVYAIGDCATINQRKIMVQKAFTCQKVYSIFDFNIEQSWSFELFCLFLMGHGRKPGSINFKYTIYCNSFNGLLSCHM